MNEPSQTNLTYAKKTTFTPISRLSEFLHPLTKLKLNKKAIENNRLNFPPLKPSKPTYNTEKTQLIYSNTLSLNICEEEVIKSFKMITMQNSHNKNPMRTMHIMTHQAP